MKSTRKKKARAVMKQLGWKAGAEFYARDLKAYFQKHTEEPSGFNTLYALSFIWVKHRDSGPKTGGRYDGLDPTAGVLVPWWVVCDLNARWRNYLLRNGEVSLGKIFGLEGVKKGQHQLLSKERTRTKKKEIALLIAKEVISNKKKVIQAQHDVADEVGVSIDTAQSAWKLYRRQARAAFSKTGSRQG